MIAKRVPRTKGTSSPARLVRYMVAAKGSIDPQSWKRTADYILDTGQETHQGERVASFRVTNCGTDDPAHATTVIEATQKANTRSKADKTYHLVFSFPPGETPPLEVLHAIEDELCAAIGYADHQRISAVHVDTDHMHVHVAINKVHPTGFQNIEPYYDKHRLMAACERLEIEHGLQRTNHGIDQEKEDERAQRRATDRGHDRGAGRSNDGGRAAGGDGRSDERAGGNRDDRIERPDIDASTRVVLRQSYDYEFGERPEAQTLNGLRNLSGVGVAPIGQGAEVLLPGDAPGDVGAGGQDSADGLRRAGGGDRGHARADGRRLTGRAADMEIHGGTESLAGYVQRKVAGTLRGATSWKDVHAALAEHGLEMRPRGAGLVIGNAATGVYVRASTVDRDFAMKAMTDRLGGFEGGRAPGGRTFKPRPVHQHVNSAGLFAQFQREQQATKARRAAALAIVRSETVKHAATVRGWRKTQQAAMKAMPGGSQGKRIARATAAASAKLSIAAQRAEAKKARARIATELPVVTWQTWLVARADAGDADALAVLRSREEREQRIRRDMLTAKDTAAARQVVMQNLSPRARKDGSIVYRTADGGMVIDRQKSVQAQKATTGAAFIALTLAAERFQGQALIVEGADEFRAEVARLAGLKGVDVRFADASMETQRLAAVPAPKPQEIPLPAKPAIATEKPAKPAISAVDAYIADRNKARERISSIDYNRRWGQGDAGPVKYLGRRSMSDGTEVVLLGRNGETLVKPVSSAVAAKAAGWKVGRMVTLAARGRFVDNSKAKGNER